MRLTQKKSEKKNYIWIFYNQGVWILQEESLKTRYNTFARCWLIMYNKK